MAASKKPTTRGRQGTKGKQGIQGVEGAQGVQGPEWESADIGALHEKMDILGNDVRELTKVIWKGNGIPSIMTRLDRTETITKSNADTVDALTKDVNALVKSIDFCKDEIIKHPSINRWIASSPAKALSTIGGFIVAIAVALVGLHAIVSIPGVALWVERALGLP